MFYRILLIVKYCVLFSGAAMSETIAVISNPAMFDEPWEEDQFLHLSGDDRATVIEIARFEFGPEFLSCAGPKLTVLTADLEIAFLDLQSGALDTQLGTNFEPDGASRQSIVYDEDNKRAVYISHQYSLFDDFKEASLWVADIKNEPVQLLTGLPYSSQLSRISPDVFEVIFDDLSFLRYNIATREVVETGMLAAETTTTLLLQTAQYGFWDNWSDGRLEVRTGFHGSVVFAFQQSHSSFQITDFDPMNRRFLFVASDDDPPNRSRLYEGYLNGSATLLLDRPYISDACYLEEH
jgi:hypothetical protein